MDFLNRFARSNQQTAGADGHHTGRKDNQMMRLLFGVLLFSATALVVALVFSMIFGSNNPEARLVDKTKYQAVFLNGGQVYFGKIGLLSERFIKVSDIYYLRVNQQVQPTQSANNQDISLVKLGCELHGPSDQMVINREQVIFWENLKDDGQVAKAVVEFNKQNPNGQQCAQPSTNTQTKKP